MRPVIFLHQQASGYLGVVRGNVEVVMAQDVADHLLAAGVPRQEPSISLDWQEGSGGSTEIVPDAPS